MKIIKDMFQSIKKQMLNLVRYSRVTNTGDDSNQFPQQQFGYHDEAKDLIAVYPYGYFAKAPLQNVALMVAVGDKQRAVALPMSGKNRVKRNLKDSEVGMGNESTGSYVLFKDDKSIEIISNGTLDITVTGQANITATKLKVTGNLEVTGTSTLTGAVTGGSTGSFTGAVSGSTGSFTGAVSAGSISGGGITASGGTLNANTDVTSGGISLTGHTHGGVTTGAGSTGGPQ